MRIFIAHSASGTGQSIARAIGRDLRTAGHFAFAGSELTRSTHPFFAISFFIDSVRDSIRSADVLIAVFPSNEPIATNISAEIAYFISRASRNRLIIVRAADVPIPEYLSSPHIIDTEDVSKSLIPVLSGIEATINKSTQLIFLSYAREDLQFAGKLYARLIRDGFKVWYDQHNLRVGQDWELEINKAIRSSRAFITCLSTRSVSKRGVFQKELRRSLEVAQEIPEGELFILPIRLDDCEVPDSLRKYQWCDYRSPSDYERIRESLEVLVNSDLLI